MTDPDVAAPTRPRRRRMVVIVAGAVAVVLLAGLVQAIRVGIGPFPYPPKAVNITRASVDDSGRLLTVAAQHWCHEFHDVSVAETASKVTVTVRMRHLKGACTLALRQGVVTALLESPLDGRQIRDGTDHRPVRRSFYDLRRNPPLPGAIVPHANR